MIENGQTTIRCIICLEDYFIPSLTSSTSSQTTVTTSIGALYTPDGCDHPICQPCLEHYTKNTLEERGKKSSLTILNSDRMKFINCPAIGCNQTYPVNAIITKVFPFQHRLAIWWRQSMDNKNGFLDFLQKLKNKTDSSSSSSSSSSFTTTAPSSSSTTATATASANGGNQKHVSREFLKLALKEGWVRCPNCKFFVERRVRKKL